MMKQLTQSELKEILHYNPETGIFTWLVGRLAGSPAGSLDSKGYIRIAREAGNYARAHRLAWLYMTGEWPDCEIDHKDLNKSNNIWTNLREATSQQNKHNRKPTIKNKLGIKGVHARYGKFIAQINHNGKVRYLGIFKTPEEASEVYQKEAKVLFGDFAW